jgi:hypothetical protein
VREGEERPTIPPGRRAAGPADTAEGERLNAAGDAIDTSTQ